MFTCISPCGDIQIKVSPSGNPQLLGKSHKTLTTQRKKHQKIPSGGGESNAHEGEARHSCVQKADTPKAELLGEGPCEEAHHVPEEYVRVEDPGDGGGGGTMILKEPGEQDGIAG